MLTEASLTTSGFSARYGQTISGLVNVVTKDGGDRWRGRTAYETDRPFTSPPTLPPFQVLAEGPGWLFPSFFYCREVHQVSPEIFVLHETTKNRLSLGLCQGSKSGKKNFCQRLGLAHREAPFVIQAIATVLPT